MPPSDDPGALCDFLHRFLDDQEQGAVQTVESYCAQFPGSAAAIAQEYARLVGGDADTATRDGARDDGPRAIGPYTLHERLGQGSFGLVYRAEDTRLHRTVALKLLAHAGFDSEHERAAFEREAAIASRLEHPGICTVFEVGRDGIWTFIAMRYVPGTTLAARLAQGTPQGMPPRESAALVAKVARALHVAHEAGVVHRDVKPGNIMLGAGDEPVVVDFGLARDLSASASLARSGDVLGSPSYMAPEQIDRRLGPVDARTDVWALGVVLYECLAGHRPFDAPTQAELFDLIRRREPLPLRGKVAGVGRDLDVLVATALRKEPTRRYQSARALADELQRVLAGEPILARPVAAPVRLWLWARRNPVVALLSAAILLVLSIGLTVSTLLLARSENALRDWERLADGRRLTDLQDAAQRLWPIRPDRVPAIDAWLLAARDLLSRREDHERTLAALRLRARPATAHTAELERRQRAAEYAERATWEQRLAGLRHWRDHLAPVKLDPATRAVHLPLIVAKIAAIEADCRAADARLQERQVFEFDDVREQLQHDDLTKLVLGFRKLAGEQAAQASIPMFERWREFGATLRQRTIDAHAEAWQAATARIASNPRYGGFGLPPQVGLVPLGADPASTLEEFYDVPTGGPPPQRSADGTLVVTHETAIVLVLVPGGTFLMGAQASDPTAANYDPAAEEGEAPVHAETIAPFFLSKYEMTQGQWRRLTDDNPSHVNAGLESGNGVVDERHPVEQLSHADCVSTLRYHGLVLPTEEQWEYACRAGAATPWWCDRSELASCANLSDLAVSRMWGPDWSKVDAALDDGYATHAPVASFRANAFGLHDTIGNVAEWCASPAGLYAVGDRRGDAEVAPSIVVGTREFIVRGGSCQTTPDFARSAARSRLAEHGRNSSFGVRPARLLDAVR